MAQRNGGRRGGGGRAGRIGGGLLAALAMLPGYPALAAGPVRLADRLAALPTAGLPLERPVTIRWNDHLIPWIEAETDGDLAVALGLVHGHLRAAQIVLLRLVARGRLSEVAGPLATEIDHALRILDYGRAAPEIERHWPPETRAFVGAFVQGLNHAILCGRRPPVLSLLNLRPEPFTPEDILAIGRLAGSDDTTWLACLSGLSERGRPGFVRLWRRAVEAGLNITEPPAPHEDPQQLALRRVLGGGSRAGSNAMAVAARRSTTGGALIACDPHLTLYLPNLWLAVGVRSPSLHAVGLMVPGLPIIGLGRNPDLAWGGTNMRAASSDLFDVSRLPSREVHTQEVTIRRRLWFPARRQVRTTPWGPIVTDAALVHAPPGEAVALRWIGQEPTDEITAMLRAARARGGEEFRAAFAGFGVPPQNMVWAARDGGIGMLMAASLPDRRHIPMDHPVLDTADPDDTLPWARLRDARELPSVTDPPEGVLASANNRPDWAGPDAPAMGFFFSDDDRVTRLRELLGAKPRLSPADLSRIQTDTRSPKAARLAAALAARLAAIPGLDPSMAAALQGWDGDYRPESRAALAFELLLRHLVPALLTEERSDDPLGEARSAELQWSFVTALLLRDLDRLPPDAREALLRRTAEAAARDLARLQDWGQVHRLRVAHWLVNLPVLGRRFVLADYPVGGSRETPMKTSHGLVRERHAAVFGAMARFISDLSDPDANWFVLFGGQDGWLGSEAFADQVPLWREGRSIRVPLRPEVAAAEFPRVTRLTPGG